MPGLLHWHVGGLRLLPRGTEPAGGSAFSHHRLFLHVDAKEGDVIGTVDFLRGSHSDTPRNSKADKGSPTVIYRFQRGWVLPNNQLIVEGEWVSGVRLADARSGGYRRLRQ